MKYQCIAKKVGLMLMAGVIVSWVCMPVAQAGERSRNGSFVTGKGASGTYSGSVTGNLNEGRARSQSVTGQNGKAWNRSSTTTYDKETGSYNKTVTGNNGNTRTYTGTAQDGARSGTYTTDSGKSGSYESGWVKNEDGTWTKSGSVTNQDGKTWGGSATYGYDKDTNTVTKSVTGNNGKAWDRSVTVSPDGND